MEFSAVIFDMDGLLLDTERISLAAFNDACGCFGLADHTAVFIRCVGGTHAHTLQVLQEGLGEQVDHLDFAATWGAKFTERTTARPIPLKQGAVQLLERLSGRRLPLAVATSTTSAEADQWLRATGIRHHFDAIVGGDQVDRSKPHPDTYLKAAAALGQSPQRCLALEDSENGVRAAVSAGMTVIQIPDLVPVSPALRQLGHTVLASLDEVGDHAFPMA